MFAVVLPEITFLLSPVYLISQRFVATERETEVVRYRRNFWLLKLKLKKGKKRKLSDPQRDQELDAGARDGEEGRENMQENQLYEMG